MTEPITPAILNDSEATPAVVLDFAPLQTIEQELVAAIQAAESASIDGPDDAEGMKVAKDARTNLREARKQVDDTHALLKAPVLEYGRALDAEKNRLKADSDPAWNHINEEIRGVEAEKKERREAEKRALKARLEERARRLREVESSLPFSAFEDIDDGDFEALLAGETAEFEERQRVAAEEAAQEAEARAAREAEEAAARAAAEAKAAEERAAREEAERRAAEAEEKIREMERAAEEAARVEREAAEARERAEREAREAAERAEREAAEARAREEAEEAERQRRLAARPDADRVRGLADAVMGLVLPTLNARGAEDDCLAVLVKASEQLLEIASNLDGRTLADLTEGE